MRITLNDCLTELKTMEENSVDSIVTDPPYGLAFMGKQWDYDVPSVEIWKECLRVLKPGGHLLAFASSRTYHRMAINIEDAGFEIRDQIMWVYGSGFPKSHNLKGEYTGWGTALKPAHEPIVMARKPIELDTIADNVVKYGTGAINIDACRIKYSADDHVMKYEEYSNGEYKSKYKNGTSYKHGTQVQINPSGRWPANIMFECICDNPKIVDDKYDIRTYNNYKNTFQSYEENDSVKGEYKITDVETKAIIHTNPNCPCYMLDEQSGDVGNGWKKNYGATDYVGNQYDSSTNQCKFGGGYTGKNTYADKGGASRFFYCPKANKKERNAGLENIKPKSNGKAGRTFAGNQTTSKIGANPNKPTNPQSNTHPTVKPIALMEYLIKLVTPEKGIVLDPFMGSGTTGVAAVGNDFDFIGIEREKEYYKIAKARIKSESLKRKFF